MTAHEIQGHQFEVADNGAVFFQDIQVLIPAHGVDMLSAMHDLYEHLTSAFVEETPVEEDSIPVTALCNDVHPSGVAHCDLAPGHTERHHGWLIPDDGGEEITWPIQHRLYWMGFNILNVGGEVHVSHEALPNEVFGFSSRASAAQQATAAGSSEDALACLPGLAALAWFNEFQPEWSTWEAGMSVVRDDGLTGFIVTNEEGSFLVASTGSFVSLTEGNEEELKRWSSE